jgi:hypothetical protein
MRKAAAATAARIAASVPTDFRVIALPANQ